MFFAKDHYNYICYSMTGPSLTQKQHDILQDCLQKELDGQDPCVEKLIEEAPELVLHDYVQLRYHNFKNDQRNVAYFITDKGKEKLKDFNARI